MNPASAQTFVIAWTNAVGSYPSSVVVADVNGDGRPDIIAANRGNSNADGSLSILTNAGDGTFQLSSTMADYNQPCQVVAADFNGDGKVDLATANLAGKYLAVFTNNGGGFFTLATTVPMSEPNGPEWLAAADVNGDGKMDLLGNSLNYNSF